MHNLLTTTPHLLTTTTAKHFSYQFILNEIIWKILPATTMPDNQHYEMNSVFAFRALLFCPQDPKIWFDILDIGFYESRNRKSVICEVVANVGESYQLSTEELGNEKSSKGEDNFPIDVISQNSSSIAGESLIDYASIASSQLASPELQQSSTKSLLGKLPKNSLTDGVYT
ncbi:unnamed protein product [Lepeophtheirus salmonis]|uniref:(salmon louse) hypothetical protein n=1 Tax=Lepeophtheirus salmonis TaxID=72036 RepID=A0A7R8CI60_LEPSM|nr:unnamed protein product [Lepeophtheirus salmonis]CAF2797550.1 unnamed protein product [Lepeophtheirus salmonis]